MAASEKTGGVVVALRPGHASVRVEDSFACPRCAAGRGCGAGLLLPKCGRIVEVGAPPGVLLRPGQRVELALEPARVLHAAWLAYGLPLVAMLAAAVLTGYLSPGMRSDGLAIAITVVALIASGWWARRRLRPAAYLGRFVPTLAAYSGRTGDPTTGGS